MRVRFLHGASFAEFGLCGTDVLFEGLTISLAAVNKITLPGSIGTAGDTVRLSGTNFCESICESEPSSTSQGSIPTAPDSGSILVSV